MITLSACPRCEGAVLDYSYMDADTPLCITCGWRRADISTDVLAEVEAHLGKPSVDHPTTRERAFIVESPGAVPRRGPHEARHLEGRKVAKAAVWR